MSQNKTVCSDSLASIQKSAVLRQSSAVKCQDHAPSAIPSPAVSLDENAVHLYFTSKVVSSSNLDSRYLRRLKPLPITQYWFTPVVVGAGGFEAGILFGPRGSSFKSQPCGPERWLDSMDFQVESDISTLKPGEVASGVLVVQTLTGCTMLVQSSVGVDLTTVLDGFYH